jgi:hypothetical protein
MKKEPFKVSGSTLETWGPKLRMCLLNFIEWVTTRTLTVFYQRVGSVTKKTPVHHTFEHGIRFQTETREPLTELQVDFELPHSWS